LHSFGKLCHLTIRRNFSSKKIVSYFDEAIITKSQKKLAVITEVEGIDDRMQSGICSMEIKTMLFFIEMILSEFPRGRQHQDLIIYAGKLGLNYFILKLEASFGLKTLDEE